MSEKKPLARPPHVWRFLGGGVLINKDVGLSYHGSRCLIFHSGCHGVTALQTMVYPMGNVLSYCMIMRPFRTLSPLLLRVIARHEAIYL